MGGVCRRTVRSRSRGTWAQPLCHDRGRGSPRSTAWSGLVACNPDLSRVTSSAAGPAAGAAATSTHTMVGCHERCLHRSKPASARTTRTVRSGTRRRLRGSRAGTGSGTMANAGTQSTATFCTRARRSGLLTAPIGPPSHRTPRARALFTAKRSPMNSSRCRRARCLRLLCAGCTAPRSGPTALARRVLVGLGPRRFRRNRRACPEPSAP